MQEIFALCVLEYEATSSRESFRLEALSVDLSKHMNYSKLLSAKKRFHVDGFISLFPQCGHNLPMMSH